MGTFDDIKKSAQQKAGENPDQVEKYTDMAVDQTGDVVPGPTGGRYESQTGKVEAKADDEAGTQG